MWKIIDADRDALWHETDVLSSRQEAWKLTIVRYSFSKRLILRKPRQKPAVRLNLWIMPVRTFLIADLLDQVDEVNSSDFRKVDLPVLLSTSTGDDEDESLDLDVTDNQSLITSEENNVRDSRLNVVKKEHTTDLFCNQLTKQISPHQSEGKPWNVY